MDSKSAYKAHTIRNEENLTHSSKEVIQRNISAILSNGIHCSYLLNTMTSPSSLPYSNCQFAAFQYIPQQTACNPGNNNNNNSNSNNPASLSISGTNTTPTTTPPSSRSVSLSSSSSSSLINQCSNGQSHDKNTVHAQQQKTCVPVAECSENQAAFPSNFGINQFSYFAAPPNYPLAHLALNPYSNAHGNGKAVPMTAPFVLNPYDPHNSIAVVHSHNNQVVSLPAPLPWKSKMDALQNYPCELIHAHEEQNHEHERHIVSIPAEFASVVNNDDFSELFGMQNQENSTSDDAEHANDQDGSKEVEMPDVRNEEQVNGGAREPQQEEEEEEEDEHEQEPEQEAVIEASEEDEPPIISTTRRRKPRKSADSNYSAQSNRSIVSNISKLSIATASSTATSRGRRTLRSRKDPPLENAESETFDDDEVADNAGTFDTPKRSRRSAKSRTKSSKQGNKVNERAKNKAKAKPEKVKKSKSKKTANGKGKAQKQAAPLVDDMDIDLNEDEDEEYSDDQNLHNQANDELLDNLDVVMDGQDDSMLIDSELDSPNINENNDEKQLTENERSDEENEETEQQQQANGSKTKAKKSKSSTNKSKAKTKANKAKTRKVRNPRNTGKEEDDDDDGEEEEVKAKKQSKRKARKSKNGGKKAKSEKKASRKSAANRKRKASETDLSDSSEPDRKRVKRLSQYVEAPKSPTPTHPNLRRSKRVRFKPLAFWANERIEHQPEPLTYEKVKSSFENGEASEIIQGGTNELNQWHSNLKHKKSKKTGSKRCSSKGSKSKKGKKTSSKRGKKGKGSKEKTMSDDEEEHQYDEDDEDEDSDQTPFDGNAWVYDSVQDQMQQKCVVKTKKCINLVELSRPQNEEEMDGEEENHNKKKNEAQPASKRVRGAKGLEEVSFSCGVLEIPPSSQKDEEVSYFTEQFFVHQCEKKKLLFKLGEDSFYLSRGSMFFVPPENEYSLHNLSETHPVRLIFTLIKGGNAVSHSNQNHNVDEDDTQTQASTANM
mmetsp:Transcript_4710/g.8052  ORF Transcript_4710/g.8052 Transcript_4710/m.8052 type:complete len:1002 (+) Transcript_4710:147-3152(+)